MIFQERFALIFGGGVNSLNIRLHAMVVMVFLFGQAADLFAFSMGPISVKSDFGERFHAEIDLATDDDAPVEIAIGTPEDYERLQVNRLKIVDDLRIEPPLAIDAGKRVIKIVSDKPLFFPSFNLVIRAAQGGGTLIENYLITVDFQKSVSLGARGEKTTGAKQRKPQPTSKSKPVDLLKTPKAEEIKTAKVEENARAAASERSFPVSSRSPKSLEIQGRPAAVGKPPVPIIPPSRQTFHMPSPPALTPRLFSELKPQRGLRGKLRPRQEEEANETPSEPGQAVGSFPARLLDPPGAALASTQIYGPLTPGETLMDISKNLKVGPASGVMVSVAIWLDNWDQFILGNIHGIKKGAVLNLGNLQNRLEKLTPKTARLVFINHWREWRIIRRILSEPIRDHTILGEWETALAAERVSGREEVFRLLEAWRQSWESEDIDRHMSSFSKAFRMKTERRGKVGFPDWEKFKLAMFRRYDRVQIEARRSKLILMGDRLIASFDQSFNSEKFKSFGHKKVELVRGGQGWKIVSERFRLKPRAEKSGLSPYVIHVSSHADARSAQKAAARWIKLGLSAYFVPLNLTQDRVVYRVFVGRFSEKSLAEQIAKSLRTQKFGRYAIAAPIPYSLLAGSYGSEKDALERIKYLRDRGVSSFLFSTCERNFSHPSFKVMVGAYSQKEEVRSIQRRLTELGVSTRLIAS